MKRTSLLVAGVALVCLAQLGFAALPLILPYQGQLATNGILITATQIFSFAMYTNSAVAWQSGATVTTLVERGFFSVALGAAPQTAIPAGLFDGVNDVYLEVLVGAPGSALTTLSPRKKIVSAAAAVDSGRLAGLGGSSYMKRWTNVVVVGPGGRAGGADTDTLAAGIELAARTASPANPCAVLLLPGTYSAAVSTADVSIVGVARDACIITNSLTILDTIEVRDVHIAVSGTTRPCIEIRDSSPYLNNVKVSGGLYGVLVRGMARPTLVNIEAYGMTNAAVRDESGATIDGLRVFNRAAFEVDGAMSFSYNNIMAFNEKVQLGRVKNADGAIRGLRGTQQLEVDKINRLLLQDVDIVCARTGSALRVGDVMHTLEVKDAYLAPLGSACVVISNADVGSIRFNDARLAGGDAAPCVAIEQAPRVDFKECEIAAPVIGSSVGIYSATGDYIYIQNCWITAGLAGMLLTASNTAAYVYDTTIRTGTGASAAAIRHMLGSTSVPPRIADCRFETDTVPTQGAGTPGWNAFGGAGAVGGQEDQNGNIVAPAGGRPVSP